MKKKKSFIGVLLMLCAYIMYLCPGAIIGYSYSIASTELFVVCVLLLIVVYSVLLLFGLDEYCFNYDARRSAELSDKSNINL